MYKYILKAVLFSFLLHSSLNTIAQTLTVGNETLPALTGAGPYSFDRITFDTAFPSGVTPIVVVTTDHGSGEPMSLRVFDIDNTGFDVIQTEPTSTAGSGNCDNPTSATTPCEGAHGSVDFSYIAVTSGLQTLSDGTVIQAGINSTTTARHKIAGTTIVNGSDSITFPTSFGTNTPIVLTQIQSMNNETNLTTGATNQMTNVSVPWMTSSVSDITATNFRNGIELSEANDGTAIYEPSITAVDEDLGWIAITSGVTGSITHNSTTIGFATDLFTAIAGIGNGCVDRTINDIPETCSNPIVLGNKNTRSGIDGGWIQRCNMSTSTDASGTDVTIGFHVDEDQDRDTERNHTTESVGVAVFCEPITLPVTINYVDVKFVKSELQLNWSTSSETNSLGFEVWVKVNNQWLQQGTLVQSKSANSLEINHYSVNHLFETQVDEVMIIHLGTDGKTENFGPYLIGQKYGEASVDRKIDWNHINQKRTVKSVTQDSLNLNLISSGQGMHRIYAAQIPAFIGQQKDLISLTLSGKAVGRKIATHSKRIQVSELFDENSYIDFYATAPNEFNSRYVKNNIYQLSINSELVKNVKAKKLNKGQLDHHSQIITIEENNTYDFTSPMDDSWYQLRLFRSNGDSSSSIDFTVPNLVSDSEFDLNIDLYGVTDYPSQDTDGNGEINPDHHIVLLLNQNFISDQQFDGHIKNTIQLTNSPSSLLVEGVNTIEFRLVADTGYRYDLIHVDSVRIDIDSEFIAENGLAHLLFSNSSYDKGNLVISNLDAFPELAYAYKNNKLFELEIEAENDKFLIPRVNKALHYWLSDESNLLGVEVQNQVPHSKIDSMKNYIVISHSDFMNDTNQKSQFESYLGAKQLSSQWFNVQSIYDQFGYGFPSPEAIKKFIKHVSSQQLIEHVLLVGGDSYDYHDNLNNGNMSFIPSWYKLTNDIIFQTPTDVPNVDLNDDGYPDLSIGRWTVRTQKELATVITNTLNFAQTEKNDFLTIAENMDGKNNVSYQNQLEQMTQIFSLENNHSVSLDEIMAENNTTNPHDIIATAQQKMLEHINTGADLVMFSGHGSPTAWTFYGLMSPTVVDLITTDQSPLYMPLACYTTYYVEPSNYSLAHGLIYGGNSGSVGIAGAVTLSNYGHNEALAKLILEELNKGVSLGKATLNAKQQLNIDLYSDVILNWATLAEPSLSFK
jgi:hypothetical protein